MKMETYGRRLGFSAVVDNFAWYLRCLFEAPRACNDAGLHTQNSRALRA